MKLGQSYVQDRVLLVEYRPGGWGAVNLGGIPPSGFRTEVPIWGAGVFTPLPPSVVPNRAGFCQIERETVSKSLCQQLILQYLSWRCYGTTQFYGMALLFQRPGHKEWLRGQ